MARIAVRKKAEAAPVRATLVYDGDELLAIVFCGAFGQGLADSMRKAGIEARIVEVGAVHTDEPPEVERTRSHGIGRRFPWFGRGA